MLLINNNTKLLCDTWIWVYHVSEVCLCHTYGQTSPILHLWYCLWSPQLVSLNLVLLYFMEYVMVHFYSLRSFHLIYNNLSKVAVSRLSSDNIWVYFQLFIHDTHRNSEYPSIRICIHKTRLIVDTEPLITPFKCDLSVKWVPSYRNRVWTAPYPPS